MTTPATTSPISTISTASSTDTGPKAPDPRVISPERLKFLREEMTRLKLMQQPGFVHLLGRLISLAASGGDHLVQELIEAEDNLGNIAHLLPLAQKLTREAKQDLEAIEGRARVTEARIRVDGKNGQGLEAGNEKTREAELLVLKAEDAAWVLVQAELRTAQTKLNVRQMEEDQHLRDWTVIQERIKNRRLLASVLVGLHDQE